MATRRNKLSKASQPTSQPKPDPRADESSHAENSGTTPSATPATHGGATAEPPTLREICRCPYCRRVCALDDRTLDLVHAQGEPCQHCAFIWIGIDAYHGVKLIVSRSLVALWVRGEGLRRIIPGGQGDPLNEYVQMVAVHTLSGRAPECSPRDLPVGVEYAVIGGTSFQRDKVYRGSGHFTLHDQNGHPLSASLDGWGIYSHDPDSVVAEVREMVFPTESVDG